MLDSLNVLQQNFREVRVEPDLRHNGGVDSRTKELLGISRGIRRHHAVRGASATLLLVPSPRNVLLTGVLIENSDVLRRRLVTQSRVFHGVPQLLRIAALLYVRMGIHRTTL